MQSAMSHATLRAAAAATVLLLATATPAAADWLVLSDGERIETRGPWEVQGRLVVFTDTAGQLSSLRLADVDLEASAEATAAPPAPAPAPTPAEPEPPRQATFVLTDADVRRAAPAESGDESTAEAEAPAGARLEVIDWQEGELPDGEGLTISGILRNRSGDAATAISLTAMLYDREGQPFASGEAELATSSLMPRRQTRFTVRFPGIFDMAEVRFSTTSLALDAGEPEPERQTPEVPEEVPPGS